MAQAFRKEGDAPEELPERPVPEGPNYVTPGGLRALEAAAAALARRRETSGEDERKALDRDLRYYAARVESAIVVDNSQSPPPVVRFGATVETDAGTFSIVGQDEADPAIGKLSWSAPLAMALMGAKPGDVIDWDGGALTVLSLRY